MLPAGARQLATLQFSTRHTLTVSTQNRGSFHQLSPGAGDSCGGGGGLLGESPGGESPIGSCREANGSRTAGSGGNHGLAAGPAVGQIYLVAAGNWREPELLPACAVVLQAHAASPPSASARGWMPCSAMHVRHAQATPMQIRLRITQVSETCKTNDMEYVGESSAARGLVLTT